MKMSPKLMTALLAMGVTITSFSGCGEKAYVLDKTRLEQTVVASTDGNLGIYQPRSSFFGIGAFSDTSDEWRHLHYRDLINGEWLSDEETCDNPKVRKINSIEIVGNLIDYLTLDELKKLTDNELTDINLIEIVKRMNETEKGQEKTK